MTEAITQKRLRGEVLENQAERYAAARKAIAEEGISIKHFRAVAIEHGEPYALHNGGMTIAYRKQNAESFVEISTAICNPKEVYSRKAGTIVAVEQFMNQRRIRVPLHGSHPAEVVELLFRSIHTFLA